MIPADRNHVLIEDEFRDTHEEPTMGEKLDSEPEKFSPARKVIEKAASLLGKAAAAAAANFGNSVSAPKNQENHFFENSAADNAEIMRTIQAEKLTKFLEKPSTQSESSQASSQRKSDRKSVLEKNSRNQRQNPYSKNKAAAPGEKSSKGNLTGGETGPGLRPRTVKPTTALKPMFK